MMPGVAAQPLRRQFAGGVDPADILADLDFLAETYAVHGATAVAADVIDKPARVGGSGLEILDNDVDGVVSAIGNFDSDWLTANWTSFIEWQEVADTASTYVLWMAETVDFHSVSIVRGSAFESNPVHAGDSSTITRHIDITGPFTAGIHRIAMTRTNGKVSVSVDGGAVQTNTTPNTTLNAMMTASFGGDPTDQSYNGCFIRKVKLMTPQADALLPALSA
ncbi:hypothetical protein EN829_015090 [Mesorhizobium sp. M00.F.Ca.ET.186.01.1.1]|nr:hypothetical protein EN848_14345 [bacterium M00.F.Ca.ET.205.01.1.1]TGU53006.1 hypothetical protein EN795_15050 [bacterium M00.F.Ca.ET.152.01.1.1]TGV35975.1 hypothetical protein EN829_015090 [Mesorhizobium sp. M00.F.Ca.ET.186.01.1.1]TGZ43558.1 hypothetical protein EN805_10660 [bacterium M00.F.Ca.ET.162.01.1.1]